MTLKQVDVRYRHQAATGKPFYVNNDEVRGVAGMSAVSCLPPPTLIALPAMRCWRSRRSGRTTSGSMSAGRPIIR